MPLIVPQPTRISQPDIGKPLPFLPIETWQHIIWFATCRRGGFNVASTLPIQRTLEGLAAAGDHEIPRAHPPKSVVSVIMVCKLWRIIGISYLFESLNFTWIGERQAEFWRVPIPASLQGPTSSLRYVRRLSIALDTRHNESLPLSDFESFFTLLSLTMGLVSLSIVAPNLSSNLLETALTKCGNSLRRLDLYHFHIRADFYNLLTRLAPGLIHLGIYNNPIVESSHAILDLPLLQSLQADHLYGFPPNITWRLPSLICTGIPTTSRRVEHAHALYSQITMVHMYGVDSIRVVLNRFPALEVIAFSMHGNLVESCVTPSCPYRALRQVDVWLGDVPAYVDAVGRCLGVLSNRTLFPSIERIRTDSRGEVPIQDSLPWWDEVVGRFRSFGIGFEYPRHGDVVVPMPGVLQAHP